MGEVWKAKDRRLDRWVAIKVLPVRFDRDPQQKLRFEREAKTISHLNHPNICTLYDVGENYLVMEFLEGETLEERLERGSLPPREVLEIGAQIADALDRAHRAGVVHRDLKPANVMLTKSGAKLLDFGIARTLRAANEESATEQSPLTEEGAILGTLPYMSPEQLAGDDVDHRTDIFALGAILYEMATGQRAFGGRNRVSLIAAIAAAEPQPMSEIHPLTPAALEHVVRRCLRKEREDRWQSAHDIAEELRFIAATGSGSRPRPGVIAPRVSHRKVSWARVASVLAIAAVLAALIAFDRFAPRAPQKLLVQIPARQGEPAGVSLSPDGSRVAYLVMDSIGDYHLLVRSLTTGEEKELHRTADAAHPFWSPDGRNVGFFSTGHLYVVSAEGGAARRLCRARRPRSRAAWSRSGEIVFSASEPELLRVPVTGGTPRAATIVERGSMQQHRDPVFVSGDEFLYFATDGRTGAQGIYLGSLSNATERRLVLNPPSDAWSFIPGFIVLRKDRSLLAYAFDAASANVKPLPAIELPFNPSLFRLAGNGNVVLRARAAEERYRLLWHDRAGNVVGETGEAGQWREVALSPDGKRLAAAAWDPALGEGVILTYDLTRGVKTQIVRAPDNLQRPIWTPAGDRIVYTTLQEGLWRFQSKKADGTGDAEPLPDPQAAPPGTSHVATRIAGDTMSYVHGDDVWVMQLASGETTRVTASEDLEFFAELSPRGDWIAYASDASGTSEIYIQSLSTRQRIQISNNGGYDPKWRADSRELYYIDRADNLVAVSLTPTPAGIDAGPPTRLFHAEFRGANTGYDVTADGQRFIILTGPNPELRPYLLLVNWLEDLGS